MTPALATALIALIGALSSYLKSHTETTRIRQEREQPSDDDHVLQLSELRVRDGSLPGELMSTDMTIRMPYKIALAVTAALLTAIGGGYAANKAGSSGEQERVASLETRMNEQQAQIEGLKGDVLETRANTVQILLLLGNRHDN